MNNALTLSEVEVNHTQYGVYVSATCGKISAMVGITEYGVQVICKNAMHRAWKGNGKQFPTIAAALVAYKTEGMKAIISHADKCNA